ncbi:MULTISPECIES: hypothetical protein [Streptomyces]
MPALPVTFFAVLPFAVMPFTLGPEEAFKIISGKDDNGPVSG